MDTSTLNVPTLSNFTSISPWKAHFCSNLLARHSQKPHAPSTKNWSGSTLRPRQVSWSFSNPRVAHPATTVARLDQQVLLHAVPRSSNFHQPTYRVVGASWGQIWKVTLAHGNKQVTQFPAFCGFLMVFALRWGVRGF